MHLQRFWKTGSIEPRRTATPTERFVRKTTTGPPPKHLPHLGPCTLWTGAHQKREGEPSYGLFRFDSGRPRVLAHRAAWYLSTGTWPSDVEVVCHHCDTPLCVRFEHLFLGTQADNLADMRAKRRGHVPKPPRQRSVALRGVENGKAVLTDQDIQLIRARRATSTLADLAEDYGISIAQISRICRREAWAHVPDETDIPPT